MERLTTNVVPPVGPIGAKIYWFGEAPGAEEDRAVEPFVGSAGQLLNRVWAKKRIIRTDQCIGNIFSQRPPNNRISYFYEDKGPKQMTRLTWEGREHLERLRIWLEKILERRERTGEGPNLLVAMGRQAMYHLTGKKRIYKWRGSVLPCTLVEGFKVYPTLHPSHVMRTMQEEKVKLTGQKKERMQNALPLFEIDMDRILEQAQFKEIRTKKRTFSYNLSFDEVMKRLNDIIERKPSLLSCDIETLPGPEGTFIWMVGFSDSPEKAFTVHLVKGLRFAWSLEEEAQILRKISTIFLDKAIRKVFQGGLYDLALLGRCYGLRLADGAYEDTMYCHHASYPFLWKSLEVLCSIYIWENYYKDEGRVNLKSRTDESEGAYNCKDCAVTREILPIVEQNAKELGTYKGYKSTMSILPSHLGMTIKGVRIDKRKLEALGKEFDKKAKECKERIEDIVKIKVNLNSAPQKKRLLYGYLGLPLQLKRGTKKPTSDKNALYKLRRICKGENRQIVSDIIDYQKFAKLSSTYAKIRLDRDGRIHTSYGLTTTWRMNSSSSPFGGWTKDDREGGNLQNIPVRSEEGRMIRSCFIPDKGQVFLFSDRVQAEAMYVSWDSQDVKKIELFKKGWDVHWYNTKLIFHMPPNMEYNEKAKWRDPITKEEHTLGDYRFIGKTVVHAGNYGMGPFMLQDILSVAGFFFDIKECRMFLQNHKNNNPFLLSWQREIRDEVRTRRLLIGPAGRKRFFLGRFNDTLYRVCYAFKPQNYVGELTERTIQRIWSHLPIYECLLNIHDEVGGQCRPSDVDECKERIKELSSMPIMIKGRVLDIPVDFKVGENWGDLKEI